MYSCIQEEMYPCILERGDVSLYPGETGCIPISWKGRCFSVSWKGGLYPVSWKAGCIPLYPGKGNVSLHPRRVMYPCILEVGCIHVSTNGEKGMYPCIQEGGGWTGYVLNLNELLTHGWE